MTLTPGSLVHTALLAAIGGTVALSVDIVLPALPLLARSFDETPAHAQLTIGMFLLGLALGITLWGALADRFGRRPVLLAGLTVFTLGGLMSAFAPTIETLIAARLVQGAGAAAGRVLAPAIIRDYFSGTRGAHLFSRMMMMLTLAPLVAPLIGGMLIEFAHWRAIFVLLAVTGALLIVLAYGLLEESLRAPDRDALRPRRVIANWRRFFGTRECVANAALQTCAFCAMYAYISGSPFVLINGLGVPSWAYGFFFASTAGLMILGNAVNSRTVAARGVAANRRVGIMIAAIGCAGGIALAALDLKGIAGMVATMAPVWVFIFANGIITPNATAGVMEPHPDMAGVSAAILGAMQMSSAMVVGFVVTMAFDGTALSMACAMALFSGIGLLIDRLGLPDRRRTGDSRSVPRSRDSGIS
jgi:DHA1 family bicyclomycin/chloramphenicol resistance-like MFS transporter